MNLHNLKYTKGARGHKRRTYGRGFSSGLGKTSGRGTKGQHARKSGNLRIGFEGGQTPIYRKIPKVGFNNYNFKKNIYVINLDQIISSNLTVINRENLLKHGLIEKQPWPIKLIGSHKKDAKINSAWEISVELISKPLLSKLTAAKAKVELLTSATEPITNKKEKSTTKKATTKTSKKTIKKAK